MITSLAHDARSFPYAKGCKGGKVGKSGQPFAYGKGKGNAIGHTKDKGEGTGTGKGGVAHYGRECVAKGCSRPKNVPFSFGDPCHDKGKKGGFILLDNGRKFVMKKRAFDVSVDQSEIGWHDDEYWYGDDHEHADASWYCNYTMVGQHAQSISDHDALSGDSIRAVPRAVVETQSHAKKSKADHAPDDAHAMTANACISPTPGSAVGMSPSITKQLLARANAGSVAAKRG